jgi:Flp pilus assembly protein TadD
MKKSSQSTLNLIFGCCTLAFAIGCDQHRAIDAADTQDANARNALAVSLLQKGDLKGAISELRTCIRTNPRDWMAHLNLGIALTQNNDPNEAITEFREVMSINPTAYEPHYNLGYLFQKQHNLDAASTEYRRSIQLNPDHAPSYQNLMQVLIANGDRNGSMAILDDSHKHLLLGNSLMEQGNVDNAINEYRRAIVMFPAISTPYYNLGIALEKQGNADDAIVEFRKAIQLNENETRNAESASYHHALGAALAKKGDRQEAIAELKIALQINPNDAMAQRDLEILSH